MKNKINYQKKINNMLSNVDICLEPYLAIINNYMLHKVEGGFETLPAAVKHHHNYMGGLIEHTYEVMKYTQLLAKEFNVSKYMRDILILSAYFHDYGKLFGYSFDKKGNPTWTNFNENDIIYQEFIKDNGFVAPCVYYGHKEMEKEISNVKNGTMFFHRGTLCSLDEKVFKDIDTCVKSHHGKTAWGSMLNIKDLDIEYSYLFFADYFSSCVPIAKDFEDLKYNQLQQFLDGENFSEDLQNKYAHIWGVLCNNIKED